VGFIFSSLMMSIKLSFNWSKLQDKDLNHDVITQIPFLRLSKDYKAWS